MLLLFSLKLWVNGIDGAYLDSNAYVPIPWSQWWSYACIRKVWGLHLDLLVKEILAALIGSRAQVHVLHFIYLLLQVDVVLPSHMKLINTFSSCFVLGATALPLEYLEYPTSFSPLEPPVSF
jgi:hypothetical protein